MSETHTVYVKRNSSGQIVAVSVEPRQGFEALLDPGDPELQAFQNTLADARQAGVTEADQLRSSDAELVRVVEDIINLLTDKGIIQFTELPPAAQHKLLQRKNLRRHIRHLDLLDDDEHGSVLP